MKKRLLTIITVTVIATVSLCTTVLADEAVETADEITVLVDEPVTVNGMPVLADGDLTEQGEEREAKEEISLSKEQPQKLNIFISNFAEQGFYGYDESMPRRKSHENPSVQKLYAEYMGEPCGEKAHHILHTSYVKRTVHDIDAWNKL